jgi:hypothetical protein
MYGEVEVIWNVGEVDDGLGHDTDVLGTAGWVDLGVGGMFQKLTT